MEKNADYHPKGNWRAAHPLPCRTLENRPDSLGSIFIGGTACNIPEAELEVTQRMSSKRWLRRKAA
jgi:hypothetical protein